MGALRTSEDAGAIAGEGKQSTASADRTVDAEASIIIDGGPLPAAPTPKPARPLPQPGLPEQRAGGLWLVIVVYILASAALAAAIYERYYL